MFSRVLIANRGEIALRVIRACKELGIRAVAVHSEPDFNSLHVRCADEYLCIGPEPSSESYLNIPSIISAAEIADVDAIHPGYGFLAEDAHFAEICRSCNIAFIGPSPEVIAALGDKATAKKKMGGAGVPVIPGSENSVKDRDEALEIAHTLGYPVVIKASAGGGGRGIRVVHNDISLSSCFAMSSTEAEAAFGNGKLYIEKYCEAPRHIEFQILGDKHGKLIHLGERDCSIQRRYQKLVEETPSPALTPKLRKAMAEAALRVAKTVGYNNAGTIEFLLNSDGQFYFMEGNARIQVEHPLTEMVTGIDLVKAQILIAADEPLTLSQRDVQFRGAAIECRVYAEDPFNGFLPSPGVITTLCLPGGNGIRVDTHAYQGYKMPASYDSLVAKVIAHGSTRAEAIVKMQRALDEFVIEGIKTTIPLCQRILESHEFTNGRYSTHFVDEMLNGNK